MEMSSLQRKVSSENALVFNFMEGALVKSVKDGDWILLDEINLATAETLECLSGLLDTTSGSMVLTERGYDEVDLLCDSYLLLKFLVFEILMWI